MKDAQGHGSNGRGSNYKPLPNHPYHQRSNAELRYIIKDAGEAGRNAQQMGDERGVNKYADQANDAHTVLGYRSRTGAGPDADNNKLIEGMRDKLAGDVAAARMLASGSKSDPVSTHDAFANAKRDKFGNVTSLHNDPPRTRADIAREKAYRDTLR